MSTEADIALASMSAMVDGLVSRGVRAACVSPGSRSTPIALSLARHPAVRVHVHLDERSSAFFALGLAKASGSPVAVACTSGTAAANLFPAVVEASMARVPLVVLTADRPPELRGVGANQAIDQLELYGRYVRAFADAPVAGEASSADEWRSRGVHAAETSLAHPPGPVHLNLPFREPLVPASLEAADRQTTPPVSEERPTAAVSCGGGEHDVPAFVEQLSGVEAGLVYAGGLRSGGDDVVAIAERLGWPLVAEPHSGARRQGSLAGGQFLIQSERFVAQHLPEVVLQVGAAPISRPALGLIARTSRLLIVDPDDLVADPLRRAARRVVAHPAKLRTGLDDVAARSDDAWNRAWREASEEARSAVDALLDGWEVPFEGRIARDVADQTPPGSNLCVGSSMPIRDLDLFMRPRDDVRVLANRGASGIDGFVSTALGVRASGLPTTALIGDLTLLHDVGGLTWNARRGDQAVLVVLNNGGGQIFSLLEQRELPELEALFTTPHGVDLGAIAGAAGVGHVRVERAGDLAGSIREAGDVGGVAVVEVLIDAERDRARRAEIRRVIDEAVG